MFSSQYITVRCDQITDLAMLNTAHFSGELNLILFIITVFSIVYVMVSPLPQFSQVISMEEGLSKDVFLYKYLEED